MTRVIPNRFVFHLVFFLLLHTRLISAHVNTYAIHLYDETRGRAYTTKEANASTRSLGFEFIGPVGDLDGYFLISDADRGSDSTNSDRLQRRQEAEAALLAHEHVRWFESQNIRPRYTRHWRYNDPLYSWQWHLHGESMFGEPSHQDINVVPAWDAGINGTGVTVLVLDDGIDFNHPDLLPNWRSDASYNFMTKTNSPLPGPGETHGTRCAGQIAAVANNSVCGVGVAPGCKISGARLIATSNTDAVEASALTYASQINDVYSSSWGPSDDGASIDGPGYLTKLAMQRGTNQGRGGRGNIFVFASGNGGLYQDDCNFDGYANSVYTVAIGAIQSNGRKPDYGETCSAHLIVTYSGGLTNGITTTDVDGQCTNQHSGTSAAAPLVSGSIALMLSANPKLHWRDVQQILVDTAKITDPNDSSWHVNGAGRNISHSYGFGKLDASAAVFASQNWTSLPIPQMTSTRTAYPNRVIYAGDTLNDFIDFTRSDVRSSGISSLEHVEVTIRMKAPIRGKVTISLTSPSKTVSVLAPPRPGDISSDGYDSWTFSTVHCWGESPLGSWQLTVTDTRDVGNDNTGLLVSWELAIRGRCADSDTTLMESGYRKCNIAISQDAGHAQFLSMSIGTAVLVVLFVLLCGGIYMYRKQTPWWKTGGFIWQNRYERIDIESPTKTSPFFPLEAPIRSYRASNNEQTTPSTAPSASTDYSSTSDADDSPDSIRLLSPDSKMPPSLLQFIEQSQNGGMGGGLLRSWSQSNLLSRLNHDEQESAAAKTSPPKRNDASPQEKPNPPPKLSMPPSRPGTPSMGRMVRVMSSAKFE
ncbi:hypothetical protein SmJEL517_g05209 [Synchytrium microbalum]|uniref:P/Homo B domain-containing protein n=1 Tax=Synchytrium microbalum TaxID=1806994 RepID=A0A507C077_9FUNG|nr:uncharacterized protein SmJEL517_g05209 [Synchytrium microbalum]TPX31464.1 hypothetical protein SmJEL517_g05209 [Synchytrium microbalum]